MIQLQRFATGVIGDLIRRQPPSAARTSFAWQLAVGTALARATSVELTGGTLTVRTRGPQWGAELERASPTIVARMQHLLGTTAVREMVVQNS